MKKINSPDDGPVGNLVVTLQSVVAQSLLCDDRA